MSGDAARVRLAGRGGWPPRPPRRGRGSHPRLSKQRVWAHFRKLGDLGWLRGSGAPAVPARGVPEEWG